MSKFDAATNILSNNLNQADVWNWPEETKEEIRAAIRVLEAAGEVDKVESMATLSVLRNAVGPMSYRVYGAAEEIRAILAALPDKGKP